ncbi:DUF2339 domain-containing protein [Chryseobacterium polytrichastri]|uniref:Predicted membrane protein n=1 Tax=Chryseobacterium polytrichastri TaxID=1302687 RepID=A0A1M6QS88_9FLAO|nr:DUF2339 domain-containing protein [Chryseobacterium polytrichastri]SHK23076.1 Predicted membrane protein [Chryseobacterium polytrichastri]
MENSFSIILLIFFFLIYYKLNKKINHLEDEIGELKKNAFKNIPVTEAKQEQTIPEASAVLDENIQEIKQSTEEQNISEEVLLPPQKDWTTPIFDFLKQNALTIIGIFTLVLGIGYFVKYAIDKNWIGETARAGVGFLIGAGIMLIGHFLKKNYSVFSSIITGGGISILYFTTTIAFREYQLFSQNIAFAITCFITLISILLSYYYKSEILIIFSLFGGFLAPLMISTGESNYLFLFTYIMVLNVGMLTIAFLKQWKSVGWISFIFTTVYLSYWTIEKTQLLSIYFYIIAYIIFYAFALQSYVRKSILSTFDILMLVLINFSSIIGLVYIFNELQYEPIIIFPLIFAFVNSLLLFKEYNKKEFTTNYSVFTGITISLVTIAVALQFKTHLITTVWAIEATLLLFIWKKTNLNIFKICFYVLFPLVIITQMITWAEYYTVKNLAIIFNPVFLTSSVTVITTLTNLILLKKLPETQKQDNSFFENTFKILSFGVIYFALLLEIIYHISERPSSFIFSIGILFSLYYLFVILLFRKKLDINKDLETVLISIFFFLLILNVTFSASELVNSILLKNINSNFYIVHLLYWIPFVYTLWKILPESDFFKTKISYWLASITFVIVISSELYHLYILGNATNLSTAWKLQKHFSILYLPIIWAILASLFIYSGLKKNITELSKVGFVLLGLMILKLYAYDIWQMDNISRIIAFILLGIILLLSSFMFQRLKNIIKNMVDKKVENENLESQ